MKIRVIITFYKLNCSIQTGKVIIHQEMHLSSLAIICYCISCSLYLFHLKTKFYSFLFNFIRFYRDIGSVCFMPDMGAMDKVTIPTPLYCLPKCFFLPFLASSSSALSLVLLISSIFCCFILLFLPPFFDNFKFYKFCNL